MRRVYEVIGKKERLTLAATSDFQLNRDTLGENHGARNPDTWISIQILFPKADYDNCDSNRL